MLRPVEDYTVQEAARILRTTERTIRRRLERGDLLFAECLALWGWQVQKRGTTRARIIF